MQAPPRSARKAHKDRAEHKMRAGGTNQRTQFQSVDCAQAQSLNRMTRPTTAPTAKRKLAIMHGSRQRRIRRHCCGRREANLTPDGSLAAEVVSEPWGPAALTARALAAMRYSYPKQQW